MAGLWITDQVELAVGPPTHRPHGLTRHIEATRIEALLSGILVSLGELTVEVLRIEHWQYMRRTCCPVQDPQR